MVLKHDHFSELLGLFENKWVNLIRKVFERFSDTWIYISNNIEEAYSFLEENNIKHVRQVDRSLVTTLLVKICVISKMYNESRDKMVRYNLALWISTHVDLSLSCQEETDDTFMFNTHGETSF